MKDEMTSLERTLATLSFKEPDRVPVFLLLTMHGAKLLHMPLRQYLTKAENVAKGQLRLRELYGHDCLYPLSYGAAEVEAFGGEVIFFRDGPPNAGRPFLNAPEDIDGLERPDVSKAKALNEVLRTIAILKAEEGDRVPITGAVVSPFSLPVMQMGFPAYLDLIHEDRERFWRLMEVNQEFCVEWANLQLEAGATAIGYVDPVSSTSILPRQVYLDTGWKVAKATLRRIKGPTMTHLASGRSQGIVQDIADTGTIGLGVSALEDLGDIKSECQGRMTVIGNLNGIEMARWTRKRADEKAKEAIAKAAKGGGFILSDNHGEIPFQVPWSVLGWIMDAALRHGRYEDE